MEKPAFPEPLPGSPMALLEAWLEEARDSDSIRNPDAMALASVDGDGVPQVRFVLCRGVDASRARFTFYTNYSSAKGHELAQVAQASAAFYWDPLGRQVRITGIVSKARVADSDAYFASRSRLSQLAAWASEQSRPIEGRAQLEQRLELMRGRFGEGTVPRPPHWGGLVLTAQVIELWSSRAGRLHDRARWDRTASDEEDGPVRWAAGRLQP